MSRKSQFAKKREEIKKEVDITLAVSQNNLNIQNFSSQINKISPKILPKNYQAVFKSKSISIDDQVSMSGLEELIKINSLVKKTDLNSFLRDYENYNENKSSEKTFSLENNSILINLPSETLPYQKADDRLEQFKKFNTKLMEFERIAADKVNLMIITLKEISEMKNSGTKTNKNILKTKEQELNQIQKDISEINIDSELNKVNPELFENIKVTQFQYNDSVRTKKYILLTFWASLIFSLITVAIVITLIIKVTEV